MTNNIPMPDFTGWINGAYGSIESFRSTIDDMFSSDVIGVLVEAIGIFVIVVGTWYGVRAILRAMRAPK